LAGLFDVSDKHYKKNSFLLYAQIIQEAPLQKLLEVMPDFKSKSSLLAFIKFKQSLNLVNETINMKIIPDRPVTEYELADIYKILFTRNRNKIFNALDNLSKSLTNYVTSLMKASDKVLVFMQMEESLQNVVSVMSESINRIKTDIIKITQSPLEFDEILGTASDVFSTWEQMKYLLNHQIIYVVEHAIKYWAQRELARRMKRSMI